MSQGDVHIMMFYRRPKNVNLTHSTKFITITFLSIVSVYHQEAKTIQFIQCPINFRETSQGRTSCVQKCPLHSDLIGTSPGGQF